MAVTRAQENNTEDGTQKDDLDHILHTILGLPDTDSLGKVIKLDGYEHM